MTSIAMSLRTVSLRHLTNGDNPRHVLGDLTELANSIKSVGVLEPVVVRPLTGGYYELLDGRRRAAAARLAGCTGISAVVRGPLDADVAALVANGHRVGLTPVEQAEAFGRLRDRGHSQAEISRLTGYSVSHVSSRLALLQLDQDTLRRIQRGALHPDRGLSAVRTHRRAVSKPGRPPAPPRRPETEPGPPTEAHPVVGALTGKINEFQAFGPRRPVFDAVRAVLALHHPRSSLPVTANGMEYDMCNECLRTYPCQTVTAVAGALSVEVPQ